MSDAEWARFVGGVVLMVASVWVGRTLGRAEGYAAGQSDARASRDEIMREVRALARCRDCGRRLPTDEENDG